LNIKRTTHMINLAPLSKRLLFSAIVMVCSIFLTNIDAQNLDFKCIIDSIKINNSFQYIINIEVIGGVPDFKAFIYDGFPGKDGNIIATGIKIDERKFKFSNITLAKYYIGIIDNKYKFACKSNIEIKPLQ